MVGNMTADTSLSVWDLKNPSRLWWKWNIEIDRMPTMWLVQTWSSCGL